MDKLLMQDFYRIVSVNPNTIFVNHRDFHFMFHTNTTSKYISFKRKIL